MSAKQSPMFHYKNMPVSARIINAVRRIAKSEDEKQFFFEEDEPKSKFSFIQFSIPDQGTKESLPYISLGFHEEFDEVTVLWYNKRLDDLDEETKPDLCFGLSPKEALMGSGEEGVDLSIFTSIYHLKVLHCILETLQLGALELGQKKLLVA